MALKSVSQRIAAGVERLLRYEQSYFITMGIVHGLTNLGGSLLTAAVHGKGGPKDMMRVTTAVSYCTFAVFQIATLAVTLEQVNISWANLMYLLAGVGTFLVVENLIYTRLDSARYSKVFAVFLFVSGLLLIGKSMAQML